MKKYPPLVTEVPSLDVRRLNREGWLRPGMRWEWVWQRRCNAGNESIILYAFRKALIIAYRIPGKTTAASKAQRIQLEWSPQNKGGNRVWFSCPHCGERIAILYLTADGFRCRKCSALVYPSQYPSRGHFYGKHHRVFDGALYIKHLSGKDIQSSRGPCAGSTLQDTRGTVRANEPPLA